MGAKGRRERLDFPVASYDDGDLFVLHSLFEERLDHRDDGLGPIPVHRQPYYRARYGALNLPGGNNNFGLTGEASAEALDRRRR